MPYSINDDSDLIKLEINLKVNKTFTWNIFEGEEKLKLKSYLKGKQKENTPCENKWETSKGV